jgi:hypothetical protein
MAGVGEQGKRVREDAVDRLDGNEREVEQDADRKRPALVGSGVRVSVVVPHTSVLR